jgi:hypothetical protein
VSGKAKFVFKRELSQAQHLPSLAEKEANLSKHGNELRGIPS